MNYLLRVIVAIILAGVSQGSLLAMERFQRCWNESYPDDQSAAVVFLGAGSSALRFRAGSGTGKNDNSSTEPSNDNGSDAGDRQLILGIDLIVEEQTILSIEW